MIGLGQYAALSLATLLGVVYHAFYTREQFFPAMLYLSTSKICLVVMGNMAFVLLLLIGHIVKAVFLGKLREAEVERLHELSRHEIMETCLAMTIFREEFTFSFVGMFSTLLFVKIFHWLAQKRVEYIETTPAVSRLSHIRITVFMVLLLAMDCVLEFQAVSYLLKTRSASVRILFAFEYFILASAMLANIVKYVLYMVDTVMEGQWEHKATYIFYLELVKDLLHLLVYLAFFSIIFMTYGLPLHLIRDLYETFDNSSLSFCCFLLPSCRSSRNANQDVRPATAPHPQPPRDLLQLPSTPLILTYGLPLHLIRDLYETFRNFRMRVADFIRYRRITSNLNERFPDATPEELERADSTCIICREEMTSAKKLPCGHLFHVHCLRSWLERQQTCPTCRAPLLQPQAQPTAPPAAAAAAAAARNAAAAAAAAGAAGGVAAGAGGAGLGFGVPGGAGVVPLAPPAAAPGVAPGAAAAAGAGAGAAGGGVGGVIPLGQFRIPAGGGASGADESGDGTSGAGASGAGAGEQAPQIPLTAAQAQATGPAASNSTGADASVGLNNGVSGNSGGSSGSGSGGSAASPSAAGVEPSQGSREGGQGQTEAVRLNRLLAASSLLALFFTTTTAQTFLTSFLHGSGILASLVLSDSSESCPGILVQLTVGGNVENIPLSLMVERPRSPAAVTGGVQVKSTKKAEQLFRFRTEWESTAPTVYSVNSCQPGTNIDLPSLARQKAYLWPAEMEWWIVAEGRMAAAHRDPVGDASLPPRFPAPKYGAEFASDGVVYGGAYVSELRFSSRVELSYTITLVGPSTNPVALELQFLQSILKDRILDCYTRERFLDWFLGV
ncbi:unnamed protein product [Closterium sp. NIES-65]|nr:unnamed protein product [Closterium sp. NIES-65]